MGSSSMARVIDQWVGSCVVGRHVGGVICSWVSLVGSQQWGPTHVTRGSPILRRRANVKNPFSLEASVALRGGV